MYKKLLTALLLLAIFGFAQDVLPGITLAKQRLLILPAQAGEDSQSPAARVTAIVAGEATKLGRFEVIDRNHLQAIMDEQALQLSGIINDSDLVEIGRVAAAPEALLVTVLNFGQKGVPPEDEEEQDEEDRKTARKAGLLGVLAKEVVDAAVDKSLENVERYPNNIQTTLHCQVRKIELETGRSLAAFDIDAEHTGGNKTASLNDVLNQVTWRVSQQLRELYLLTSEVIDVRGREVILLLGENMGLKRGTLFTVNSPATKRTVAGREITIPGHQVGVIEVTDVSADAHRGLILRKWEPIEPGYPAVESTGGILAGGIGLQYGSTAPDLGLEIRGLVAPLRRCGGALLFGLGTLQDSRGDSDFNLRFGIDLDFRLIQTIPFSLGPYLSLPLNLAFRSDDAEDQHTVSSLLFAPVIGARATIMLNPHLDLVAGVGYCPTTSMSKWDYSEEEDGETNSYPAEWDGAAPKIDATGIYFNIGLRFLIFGAGVDWPSIKNLPF